MPLVGGVSLRAIEGLAGERAGLAGFGQSDSGRPALHREADEVAREAERLGIGAELGRKEGDVIRGGLELPGIAPREHAGTRRSALGIWRVGVREEHALAGDAVEAGRLHPAAAVGAGVAERPIVGDGDEDIRAGGSGGGSACAEQDQRGEQEGRAHGFKIARGGVRTRGTGR